MSTPMIRAAGLLLVLTVLSGCALAAGGVAAVAVDTALEQENGGDGLF